MRLLLTRPEGAAARTRARLVAAGHEVLLSPVMTVEPIRVAWPEERVDGLVATSAQAFLALDGEPPGANVRRALPLYLVGEKTAGAARRAGFCAPPRVAETAADLLALLPAPPQRLVYLAGRSRKPDLEHGLPTGISLTVLETYAAPPAVALSPEALEALARGAVDGVLHYSRRSAELFVACAREGGAGLAGPTHYCLSADAAAPLQAADARVMVASDPTETALLRLLEEAGRSVG